MFTFRSVYTKWLMYLLFLIVFLQITNCNPYAEELIETHFYFVQITDTHFGDSDHLLRTKKVVKHINNLPMEIKCVVHTGDITSNKIDNKATVITGLSVLKDIKVPIHYVAGNHDILPQRLKSTKQAYIKHFGGLLTQQEYDGVIFIFIYTEPLRKFFEIDEYKPLDLLESALRQAGDKPVIIFHHSPSVDDFYENRMHEGWKKDIRCRWEEILNSHNVKAVIAGHFHRDEHHWLGEVPLYVSSSVAGYWGRQTTFRIYEYKDGKIGYRTQYIQ